jgi:hypothetical protein
VRKVDYELFLSGPEFDAWCARAESARNQLLAEFIPGQSQPFKPQVWKDFKDTFLIHGNAGKCMYCEQKFDAGSYGDAEHFRPKGEVTEHRQKLDNHPGYYWLAYEWQNLLLSCEKCNRPHRDAMGVSHPGKLNEFPIDGTRVSEPNPKPELWWTELEAEKPLLLHPYFDNPEVHFDAAPEGFLQHKTEQGQTTIEVCDLNRPALIEDRAHEEGQLKTRFIEAIITGSSEGLRFDATDPFSTYLNYRGQQILDELQEGFQ